MLTRAQKEEQVAELRDKLGRATSVIVADYRGLDVQAVNQLRRRLKTEGNGSYEYRVTKNTLLRRAAEGSDVAPLLERIEGPTAIAISYDAPARLAKILVEFAKEHEVFELRAGVLEGRAVDAATIQRLATLPTLDELRGKIIGLLQAPAAQLARLLAAPAAQLARVMEARRAQLGESGGASEGRL